MKCSNCKCIIEEKESFEMFTDRILKQARIKLKQESGFGIPDIKEKQWKKFFKEWDYNESIKKIY